MKTPLNRKNLSRHFTYGWWKYLLLIVLVVFGVDLLYTTTAYRSPAEKKVEFYIYGYADTDSLDAYMESVREQRMPDMEIMASMMLTTDSTYGPMQLATYIAAGEGDLYLIPRDQFISYASSGGFIALEDDAELMAIFNDAGVSLQSGWRRDTDSGENHLYGIPASRVPGLEKYAVAQNGFLAILVSGGNDENTLKFLRILCADMIAPQAD